MYDKYMCRAYIYSTQCMTSIYVELIFTVHYLCNMGEYCMIVLSIYTCRILTLCTPTGLSHIEQALSITFTYTHAHTLQGDRGAAGPAGQPGFTGETVRHEISNIT